MRWLFICAAADGGVWLLLQMREMELFCQTHTYLDLYLPIFFSVAAGLAVVPPCVVLSWEGNFLLRWLFWCALTQSALLPCLLLVLVLFYSLLLLLKLNLPKFCFRTTIKTIYTIISDKLVGQAFWPQTRSCSTILLREKCFLHISRRRKID